MFNDQLGNANTTASVNGNNLETSTVYDFDDGIRKHTQTIYGPVLSILLQQQQTQDLLESLERDKGSERDRFFEDYKKEHQQKMSTWKMQSVQSRLRGGGAGHALGGQIPSLASAGGQGMMMSGGMGMLP